jgi:hypothetical protein
LAVFVDELILEYAFYLYKSETVLPRIAIAGTAHLKVPSFGVSRFQS